MTALAFRLSPGAASRSATDLRAALKLNIHVTLDDIRADEFYAMLTLEDEREKLDHEQEGKNLAGAPLQSAAPSQTGMLPTTPGFAL